MKEDFLKSIIFHLIIAILLVVSTWSIFSRKVEPINEIPIVVTMAPMGEKTNIKPAPQHEVKPPEPKKAAPKPPEPKKAPPKPPEPKKVEPKPIPKIDKKPKPDKKPEKDELDKELEKMDKEKDKDPLKELLKTLDDKPKAPEKSSKEAITKENSKSDQKFDENSPEALAAQDYIAKLITDQVKVCWSPPAGGRGAKNLIVRVNVDIARDGTMKFIDFEGSTGSDPVAQAAADSAKRAVLDPDCNPLRELPPADKYNIWKEMTLIFDPKDLAN